MHSRVVKTVESDLPNIGIVGGLGRMGRWFTEFFERAGFSVMVSDIETEFTPRDLAAECRVVILSLPMEVFPDVVADIGPSIPEGSLLTDLCSLKQAQVRCMLEHSSCEVVGTHPLFGPAEDDMSGRRVALCPGRGKRWLSWWEGLLQRYGALTTVITPEDHDRTMAWVQALNHFILLTLGKSLEDDGIDLKHIKELATPSFHMQMEIVSRLYYQDPELYATIQMSNPYTCRTLDMFNQHSESLKDIIKRRDRVAFIRLFKEVQELGRMLTMQEQ